MAAASDEDGTAAADGVRPMLLDSAAQAACDRFISDVKALTCGLENSLQESLARMLDEASAADLRPLISSPSKAAAEEEELEEEAGYPCGQATSEDPGSAWRRFKALDCFDVAELASVVETEAKRRCQEAAEAMPEEDKGSEHSFGFFKEDAYASPGQDGRDSCKTQASMTKKRTSDSKPSIAQRLSETATLDSPAFMMAMSIEDDEPESKSRLRSIVESVMFDSICSALILLNCATMGMQAHEDVTKSFGPGMVKFLEVSEHLFTAFFLSECLLRFQVYGLHGFRMTSVEGRANSLDAFLVFFTGVLISWFIPLLRLVTGWKGNSDFLRTLTVFRAIRLARLFHVFRRVPLFRDAWMLIKGLGDSSRTLFWTIIVILFVTYGFSIFGLKLIAEPLRDMQADTADPEEYQSLDDLIQILGGIDRFMFTMVQVLTLDSVHHFMRECVHYLPLSWMFFYAYIAVACLVLMNLVTAIIVENAMETSRSDLEHQLQDKLTSEAREMKELMQLFKMMDEDHSGTLNWHEFKKSFKDREMKKKWRLLDFMPEECQEVFSLLDDGDGEICLDEFFEGLRRMKGPAQSKDVFRLQKTVDSLQNALDSFALPPDPA